MNPNPKNQFSTFRKTGKSFITPIGIFCLAGIFALAMILCASAASVSGKTSKLWLTLIFNTSAWGNVADSNDTVPGAAVSKGYFSSLPTIGKLTNGVDVGSGYAGMYIPYEYNVYAQSATTNAQTATNFKAAYYDVQETSAGTVTYVYRDTSRTNNVSTYSGGPTKYRSIGSPISTNGFTYYALDIPGLQFVYTNGVGVAGSTYTSVTNYATLVSVPLYNSNGVWNPAGSPVTNHFGESYDASGWHQIAP